QGRGGISLDQWDIKNFQQFPVHPIEKFFRKILLIDAQGGRPSKIVFQQSCRRRHLGDLLLYGGAGYGGNRGPSGKVVVFVRFRKDPLDSVLFGMEVIKTPFMGDVQKEKEDDAQPQG